MYKYSLLLLVECFTNHTIQSCPQGKNLKCGGPEATKEWIPLIIYILKSIIRNIGYALVITM